MEYEEGRALIERWLIVIIGSPGIVLSRRPTVILWRDEP